MQPIGEISGNSRRIVKNTFLLYVRMLVMMVVGLFTYRIILRSLGITDYGVYAAVAGVITMFMLVMNTVASAITRFITVGLGQGDIQRLRAVFCTSVAIMAGFCLILTVLTATAGSWYLHTRMVIPPGRMQAAEAVLYTSLLCLVVNLLTLPCTAVINAHEHMGAYAWLSILEAVMKLVVAACVWFSSSDRLVLYAWLLVAAAGLSRGAYALYAHLRYEECRGRVKIELPLVKEIGSFAGWNFLGSGAYMLNTQGVNQLVNIFFGVRMNAARGIADKVEQVVRQFATNIALALNPQLTKSYAAGDRNYAFELVCKGSKYYFWVLWVMALPFLTDAEGILRLWIGGDIPPEAALFTRLALLCFLVDFTPGTLNILEQAHGKIRRYYLITSGVALTCFIIAYAAFKLGAPAWAGYAAYLLVYLFKAAAMLMVARSDTGFPVGKYLRTAVLPMLAAVLPPVLLLVPVCLWVPAEWWRFLLSAAVGCAGAAAGAWLFGLTGGEKAFLKSKIPFLR
ncbi:MAG: hypothetical protein IJS66_06130 [Bacteroidales bacterium]|nr:hypothetical protein [Bacteroidales bacterium]